jgi:hypothetical protein
MYSANSIPEREVIKTFLKHLFNGAIQRDIRVGDTFEVDHAKVLKACRLKDEIVQIMYAVCEKHFRMCS